MFITVSLSGTTACNSLFYYPDHETYLTPDKEDIPFAAATVTSADGTRLAVWHLHALGRSQNAVVVQFHGNAQNMSAHVTYVAWLADYGFDVVTFDYRGYGGSAGTPDRTGVVADGQAVLAWVNAQPALRGKDVFLLGQSLGGAIAVPVAVRTPPFRLKGVIVESTFDSYRGVARGMLGNFWLTWPLQWPLSFLVTDSLSPLDDAPALQIPFLGIHGTNDRVVPIKYGANLYAACAAADKEFWAVPRGGHLAAFGDDDSPWRERLVQWLCKHASRCSR